MTADQRLDQLELLVSQMLAVADRHTTQLKQFVGFAIQHSDDIQLAVRELSDVKQDVGELKKSVDILVDAQEITNERLSTVDTTLANLDTKLDRLLGLLDKS